MKEVITQFGTIYSEDFSCNTDKTKIKIYDSEERYLNYFEASSFGDSFRSPEDDLQIHLDYIAKCESIEHLANILFFDGYKLITTDWREAAEFLGIEEYFMPENLLENEWVNKIGNYYIVVTE